MLKMTKPNGVIVFDIMNSESVWNRKLILKKNILFPLTILKNIAKRLLNIIYPRRWLIDQVFGMREIMYSPAHIIDLIRTRGLSFSMLNISQVEALDPTYQKSETFSPDQKLVFVISKH